MNKKDILDKIKSLDGLSSEERAYLVNLVNTKKKYGLVWEDKPEEVEEQLRTKLPILKEVKERAIINDTETEKHPNHILIEGDNLHGLTALTFTHESKIDLIYIDPPYNTGNKDFIYNDHYVDKEDSYRHSKWLSFIHKRLQIAHKLLADDGVIFISIDDNEQANLTVLCNEIFGETNQIAVLPTIMNLKGNQDQFGFAGTHEYTVVYSKNKSKLSLNELPYDSEELEKWEEDEIGFFKKGAPLRATGAEATREHRPNMFYPILVDKDDNLLTITQSEYGKLYDNNSKSFNDHFLRELSNKYKSSGYEVVWPMVDKKTFGRWRWGFNEENRKRLSFDGIVNRSGQSITLYKKQRPSIGDIPSKKPKSLLYRPEYSSGNGTSQLKEILGSKLFDNPKPRDLILDMLRIGASKDSKVLDFFAGSGTFLDAVMHLNKYDSWTMEAIIVTNNENRISETVTYPRIKKLITESNNKIDLSNNNLRYYQCDFVERQPSLANKRQLTQLATELLCIKEDCYQAVNHELSFVEKEAQIFTNGKGKYLVAIYHSRNQMAVQEQLIEWINTVEDATEKIRLYAFSPEKETLVEEFVEVENKIEAVPLPEAIYNAYLATIKTLKVDKKNYELNTADEAETTNN